MNWGQFKDSVYHLSLAGAVVASWSLTLEATGSNPFHDKYLGKTQQCLKNLFQYEPEVHASCHEYHREFRRIWNFGLLHGTEKLC